MTSVPERSMKVLVIQVTFGCQLREEPPEAASEDQEDLSHLLYRPAPGGFSGPTERLAVSSLPGCDKQMKPRFHF